MKFGVLGGIAVSIVLCTAGCASTSTGNVGAGTSTHPALADVKITGCENKTIGGVPNSGTATADLLITNHSSGVSDYDIQVGFFRNGVRVDDGYGIEDSVAAGGKVSTTAGGTTQLANSEKITCKIINVDRLASASGQNG